LKASSYRPMINYHARVINVTGANKDFLVLCVVVHPLCVKLCMTFTSNG
jgi:hypothetical protein